MPGTEHDSEEVARRCQSAAPGRRAAADSAYLDSQHHGERRARLSVGAGQRRRSKLTGRALLDKGKNRGKNINFTQ